jgi:hypothetical protein
MPGKRLEPTGAATFSRVRAGAYRFEVGAQPAPGWWSGAVLSQSRRLGRSSIKGRRDEASPFLTRLAEACNVFFASVYFIRYPESDIQSQLEPPPTFEPGPSQRRSSLLAMRPGIVRVLAYSQVPRAVREPRCTHARSGHSRHLLLSMHRFRNQSSLKDHALPASNDARARLQCLRGVTRIG